MPKLRMQLLPLGSEERLNLVQRGGQGGSISGLYRFIEADKRGFDLGLNHAQGILLYFLNQ
jgi:hypothetical protein